MAWGIRGIFNYRSYLCTVWGPYLRAAPVLIIIETLIFILNSGAGHLNIPEAMTGIHIKL